MGSPITGNYWLVTVPTCNIYTLYIL
jgi:hypothetical protein